MRRQTSLFIKVGLLTLLSWVGCLLWVTGVQEPGLPAAGTPHRVHVAFGFHGNLYHSFRVDTNDENGFGQDIRVIRHILDSLDRHNRDGIPVKAVWDFDNLFSLQEILPRHAPDILSDLRRRIRENGDEAILMSYNNGLASAMTEGELRESIRRAISNRQGSGVMDRFGSFSPIVRPQEMMTSAGNFDIYRSMGIPFVCLYYSATPFDAFRMFSRKLSPAEAHNPIRYRNPETGETAVLIPTYHIGDLVEQTGLRQWARKLHRMQREGRIDSDVLIFINFDADSEFWTGTDLSWYLDWLPNTGGIDQLIQSVADLHFVSFTTLGEYLEGHPVAGEVHFSQDTADGSFNGYNSWAEKSYASDYWTRIVDNRRAHRIARQFFVTTGDGIPEDLERTMAASFDLRLRALSTTHFGLATPFLPPGRERAMESLLKELATHTETIHKRIEELAREHMLPSSASTAQRIPIRSFFHLSASENRNTSGDRVLYLHWPPGESGSGRYFLADGKGKRIPVRTAGLARDPHSGSTQLRLRISAVHPMENGVYHLFRESESPHPAESEARSIVAGPGVLKNRFVTVRFSKTGRVEGVDFRGEGFLKADSLTPRIRYKGEISRPNRLQLTVEQSGRQGVGEVRLQGKWEGPPETARVPGYVDYRLRLVEGLPYLYVEGTVTYPDTRRDRRLDAHAPVLARMADAGWQEAAPAELRFSHPADPDRPFVVLKRNFLGRRDAYPVDYHRHDSANRNLSVINNHVTESYAAVSNGRKGMAVAMDNTVRSNFAFLPFQQEYDPGAGTFFIRANPFGTYHGRQPHPPTDGNGQGYEATLLAGKQYESAAPTYNGFRYRFSLMIGFFDGPRLPAAMEDALRAFAHPPELVEPENAVTMAFSPSPAVPEGPPRAPAGFMAAPHEGGVWFRWEAPIRSAGTLYRVYCGPAPGRYDRVFETRVSELHVDFLNDWRRYEDGEVHAVVRAVSPGGRISGRSREVRFRPFHPPPARVQEVPIGFQARYVWENVRLWIAEHLL